MTQSEYNKAKEECWEGFWDEINGNVDFAPGVNDRMKEHIYDTFDRAYALGREHPKPDTEEEEMLTVSRKKVQDLFEERQFVYDVNKDIVNRENAGLALLNYAAVLSLVDLFGTKCLPDNVVTSASNVNTSHGNVGSLEPKFTKGSMVHCTSFGYEGDYKVLGYTGGSSKCYDCIDRNGYHFRFYESDLEPYAKPTDNPIPPNSGELNSQEAEIRPINTKDSSSKERKLNIAAQFLSAMLSNPSIFSRGLKAEDEDYIIHGSLEFAGALIALAEELGNT